jgi:hypothetical protein
MWLSSMLMMPSFRGHALCCEWGWSAERAEVHSGQEPVIAAPDGHVCAAEASIGAVALVLGPLAVASDGDRGVAVGAHLDLVPYQRMGGQRAGAVAVEPLLLVQHEAEGSDECEVFGRQRVKRFDVAALLCLGPAATQLADPLVGGAAHSHVLCSVVVIGRRRGTEPAWLRPAGGGTRRRGGRQSALRKAPA